VVIYCGYPGKSYLVFNNGKEVGDRLHAGDTVHVNNRHIVPVEESDSIEVNLPQRMLFHFEDSELRGVYPVAVGQPGKQWQTPIGSFVVIQTGGFSSKASRTFITRAPAGSRRCVALRRPTEIESQIDWTRAEEVVNDAEGIDRDVSFHSEHVSASEKPIKLATNDKMPADVAVESLMPDSNAPILRRGMSPPPTQADSLQAPS
jgi:hypothetical protein